jgi:hypothetical protein
VNDRTIRENGVMERLVVLRDDAIGLSVMTDTIYADSEVVETFCSVHPGGRDDGPFRLGVT